MRTAAGKWLALAAGGLVLTGVSPVVSAQQYTYDSAGRLTRVLFSNNMRLDFTYDRAGNRLTETYQLAVAQVDKGFEAIAEAERPSLDDPAEAAEVVLAEVDAVTDDADLPVEAGPSAAEVLSTREAAAATSVSRR